MGTTTTIQGAFLLAAIGASTTISPFPYQFNPLKNTSIFAKYQNIDAFNGNKNYQIIERK